MMVHPVDETSPRERVSCTFDFLPRSGGSTFTFRVTLFENHCVYVRAEPKHDALNWRLTWSEEEHSIVPLTYYAAHPIFDKIERLRVFLQATNELRFRLGLEPHSASLDEDEPG